MIKTWTFFFICLYWANLFLNFCNSRTVLPVPGEPYNIRCFFCKQKKTFLWKRNDSWIKCNPTSQSKTLFCWSVNNKSLPWVILTLSLIIPMAGNRPWEMKISTISLWYVLQDANITTNGVFWSTSLSAKVSKAFWDRGVSSFTSSSSPTSYY